MPNSYIPTPEKIISSHYDYTKVFQFIDQKGKEIYGRRFRLHSEDQNIILQLAAYFLRDEQICKKQQIDLHKGMMLTGPIGCGKTTLMNLMRYLVENTNRYIIKSARDVTFEFIQDGYDTIHRYSRGKLYNTEYKNFCFDDLGTENNIKYFGNECNVMAEILLSRYDLFVAKKLVTHITTNLSATELEQTYGNRLRSRLREMVNLIGFDQEVKDKRK